MKQLHIALLLLLSGVAVWAGNNNTSYNIQRALEAAQQRDYETSLSFLQQELQENPTNGDAHAYIAAVCDMLPDYKSVTFHYAKTSLPLLPKDEGFLKASMEGMLSDIYYEAGDTLCALTHQKLAVSYLPTSTRFTGRLATMYEDMHNWQANWATTSCTRSKAWRKTPWDISSSPQRSMVWDATTSCSIIPDAACN